MTVRVVVLDVDIARAIKRIIDRAEKTHFNLTEYESEMWGILVRSIQNAQDVEESQE